jgi:hypothetical protein
MVGPQRVHTSQFFGFVFAARAVTEDGEGDHYDHHHKDNHDGELDEREKQAEHDDHLLEQPHGQKNEGKDGATASECV